MINNNEFNQENFEFLKKHTFLSPLSKLKIQRLKIQIENFRKWYYEHEGELLDPDYHVADEFEYELRLIDWKNQCAPFWEKTPNGMGLLEFSEMLMYQSIEKQKKLQKNK